MKDFYVWDMKMLVYEVKNAFTAGCRKDKITCIIKSYSLIHWGTKHHEVWPALQKNPENTTIIKAADITEHKRHSISVISL